MTTNELNYARFDKMYNYDYQANEDGSNSTVIFSFWAKNDLEYTFTKFEAKSLEKAFINAMCKAGITKYADSGLENGDIMQFSHDKWNELNNDRFWSLQDQCWKSKKSCIAAEEAERIESRLRWNKQV